VIDRPATLPTHPRSKRRLSGTRGKKKPRRFRAYEALFRRLRSTSEDDIYRRNPVVAHPRIAYRVVPGEQTTFLCRGARYIGWDMVRSASETLGFIKPELPTLVPEPHSGEGWIHEIKHDGYRTLIVIDQGKVRAFSRLTGPYRRVVEAASKLSCKAALIDGEIIVQDENGLSDFDALLPSTQRRTGSCSLPSTPATERPGSARASPHGASRASQEAGQAGCGCGVRQSRRASALL
jgi:hypothetical protein